MHIVIIVAAIALFFWYQHNSMIIKKKESETAEKLTIMLTDLGMPLEDALKPSHHIRLGYSPRDALMKAQQDGFTHDESHDIATQAALAFMGVFVGRN